MTDAVETPGGRPGRRSAPGSGRRARALHPALVAAAALAVALAGAVEARTVTFNGSIGERAALLLIDGQPRTVAVGASVAGVRLVSLAGGQAHVEVDGQQRVLAIGAPVRLGAAAPSNGTQIVLAAGLGGHFYANGSINGRPVRFLVDTGATTVAMGEADAERIGLDWRHGRRAMSRTANGAVVVHRVTLSAVRIGDVEVANVEAVVLPGVMEHVLLGNSFLSRFSMRRDSDILRLEKRP